MWWNKTVEEPAKETIEEKAVITYSLDYELHDKQRDLIGMNISCEYYNPNSADRCIDVQQISDNGIKLLHLLNNINLAPEVRHDDKHKNI